MTISQKVREQRAVDQEQESNNKELRGLQLILKSDLIEIVKVCNELNLAYYLIGGTLLGAVRHEGFIPWDDDIDIAMPREDYEKFLNLAEPLLPENLEIIHYSKKNKGDFVHWLKIVDKNYFLVRKLFGHTVERNVFLDIFPLDGIPAHEGERIVHKCRVKIQYYKVRLARIAIPIHEKGYASRPLHERIIFKLNDIIPFAKHLNIERQLYKFDKLLKKYRYKDCDYVVNCVGGNGFFRELFSKKDMGQGMELIFEDLRIKGPDNYDAVLKQIYGDYMTLPPKEEQICKHYIELEEHFSDTSV